MLQRTSKHNPCPLCKHEDASCAKSIRSDGRTAWICLRTTGEVMGGWVYLGEAKSGMGGIYCEEDAAHQRSSQRTSSYRQHKEKASQDAGRLIESHRRATAAALNDRRRLADAELTALVTDLGLPRELVACYYTWIPNDGWNRCGPAAVEYDAQGEPIGIQIRFLPEQQAERRRRDPNAPSKVNSHGRGLAIPGLHDWLNQPGPIYIVEGWSDTLALTALGCAVLGRPSSNGGSEQLIEVLAACEIPSDRDIIIVAERDKKADGRWPGMEGATSTAQRFSDGLHRSIRVCLPPGDAKDARAWFTAHWTQETAGTVNLDELGQQWHTGVELIETVSLYQQTGQVGGDGASESGTSSSISEDQIANIIKILSSIDRREIDNRPITKAINNLHLADQATEIRADWAKVLGLPRHPDGCCGMAKTVIYHEVSRVLVNGAPFVDRSSPNTRWWGVRCDRPSCPRCRGFVFFGLRWHLKPIWERREKEGRGLWVWEGSSTDREQAIERMRKASMATAPDGFDFYKPMEWRTATRQITIAIDTGKVIAKKKAESLAVDHATGINEYLEHVSTFELDGVKTTRKVCKGQVCYANYCWFAQRNGQSLVIATHSGGDGWRSVSSADALNLLNQAENNLPSSVSKIKTHWTSDCWRQPEPEHPGNHELIAIHNGPSWEVRGMFKRIASDTPELQEHGGIKLIDLDKTFRVIDGQEYMDRNVGGLAKIGNGEAPSWIIAEVLKRLEEAVVLDGEVQPRKSIEPPPIEVPATSDYECVTEGFVCL